MAYLFFDGGAPDSDEYISNYIYFDESNEKCLKPAMRLASEVASGKMTLKQARAEINKNRE